MGRAVPGPRLSGIGTVAGSNKSTGRSGGSGRSGNRARSAAAEPPPTPSPPQAVLDQLTDFEAAVVAVLVSTGPGDVLAYGEVAAEAGYPGAARAVGNVLRRIDDLPWWRVVTAAGRLIPHHPAEQARRLAAEGVATSNGRIVTDL